jgi:hypothetical protein
MIIDEQTASIAGRDGWSSQCEHCVPCHRFGLWTINPNPRWTIWHISTLICHFDTLLFFIIFYLLSGHIATVQSDEAETMTSAALSTSEASESTSKWVIPCHSYQILSVSPLYLPGTLSEHFGACATLPLISKCCNLRNLLAPHHGKSHVWCRLPSLSLSSARCHCHLMHVHFLVHTSCWTLDAHISCWTLEGLSHITVDGWFLHLHHTVLSLDASQRTWTTRIH